MRKTNGIAAPAAVAAASFLAGSVPYCQLAARHFAGADLRRVGSGTVSGTALYRVAGFGPLAAAGVMDVAKGAVGPLLVCRVLGTQLGRSASDRRRGASLVGALAAGAAIAGHNWSPWLGGAGGRGLSPALGATLVLAPEGTAVLAAGMVAGRLLHQSGVATLLAILILVPVLGARRRAPGVALGLSICTPMLIKRVLGNAPLRPVMGPGTDAAAASVPLTAHVISRLLFDREARSPIVAPAHSH
jgi:acyl phosphate:glycerol-3-phosphate acyltransferase